jgi:hypothetical protein
MSHRRMASRPHRGLHIPYPALKRWTKFALAELFHVEQFFGGRTAKGEIRGRPYLILRVMIWEPETT